MAMVAIECVGSMRRMPHLYPYDTFDSAVVAEVDVSVDTCSSAECTVVLYSDDSMVVSECSKFVLGVAESSRHPCDNVVYSMVSSGEGGDFVPAEKTKDARADVARGCVSDGTDVCVAGLPPDHHSMPVALVEVGASICRSMGGTCESA